MASNVEFVEWLQAEMAERRWDQAELRRRTRIAAAQISRILSGERSPGPKVCRAIARALHLSPEEVFRRAGLLPESKGQLEGAEELLYLYGELSDYDRQHLLAVARTFRVLSAKD